MSPQHGLLKGGGCPLNRSKQQDFLNQGLGAKKKTAEYFLLKIEKTARKRTG